MNVGCSGSQTFYVTDFGFTLRQTAARLYLDIFLSVSLSAYNSLQPTFSTRMAFDDNDDNGIGGGGSGSSSAGSSSSGNSDIVMMMITIMVVV